MIFTCLPFCMRDGVSVGVIDEYSCTLSDSFLGMSLVSFAYKVFDKGRAPVLQ